MYVRVSENALKKMFYRCTRARLCNLVDAYRGDIRYKYAVKVCWALRVLVQSLLQDCSSLLLNGRCSYVKHSRMLELSFRICDLVCV